MSGPPRRRPSAGYGLVLRVTSTEIGVHELVGALGDAGGVVTGAISEPGADGRVVHVVYLKASDELHQEQLVGVARGVHGVVDLDAIDEVYELHEGGKIEVNPRFEVRDDDELAQAYTPGVGRISRAVADDPERVWDLTGRGNAVAVLSNGSAVLGLGDIGPRAALPVMEGKAMLFKSFADVDAYPVCVDARSTEELVAVGRAIAPTFGGLNLEDVAAPMCFEVERRLAAELDVPVFHDDQHGTAIVTVAALLNATRVVDKAPADLRVVILGLGAAGIATGRLLEEIGVADVVGVDSRGIVHDRRVENMNDEKRRFAAVTNPEGRTGDLADALRGADVLIGVSGPGLVQPEWVATMSDAAIVFAMANPVPEIAPEIVPGNVRVVATGRSDYPNQINNVLVFPGFFRGLLDSRAPHVTESMKIGAARALAAVLRPDEIGPRRVVPSPFDPRVVDAVATAVGEAARRGGSDAETSPAQGAAT